ncbi:transcriptional regulator with XRE-family HTH domain [Brevibacillus sp. 1238]|nr:transcriptional regulator with XRE-family HTH domain [Brevibacillus sp. 1238]
MVETVGQRIKRLRKQKGWTQQQLAKRVNVSPQVVSNWEREYTPLDHDDIAKLALILETKADYILFGKDDPSPPDKEKHLEVNDPRIGLAFITGGEDLSEEEVEYLKESLELFRRMKERKAKEREKNK